MKIFLLTVQNFINQLIVLLFKGFIEDSFGGALLPFCFMITAVLLIVSQILSKKNNKPITKTGACIMGIAQGIAVLPGISRSGATICTGLILGYDRKESANFSFLMSIPSIIASLIYELYGAFSGSGFESLEFWPLFFGFVFAFVVGLLSIKLMLKVVQNLKLYWFSAYLFIISIVSLILLA